MNQLLLIGLLAVQLIAVYAYPDPGIFNFDVRNRSCNFFHVNKALFKSSRINFKGEFARTGFRSSVVSDLSDSFLSLSNLSVPKCYAKQIKGRTVMQKLSLVFCYVRVHVLKSMHSTVR